MELVFAVLFLAFEVNGLIHEKYEKFILDRLDGRTSLNYSELELLSPQEKYIIVANTIYGLALIASLFTSFWHVGLSIKILSFCRKKEWIVIPKWVDFIITVAIIVAGVIS